MKKILKSFLGMLVVVITLSFLTSCLTQTPGVATLTYKKDAQEKMEYYFNEYKEVDYTVEKLKESIARLRAMSPLFNLKEGEKFNV